ncbi:MAG: hypothetical protein AB7F98_04265 [Novosphingobium sp.]
MTTLFLRPLAAALLIAASVPTVTASTPQMAKAGASAPTRIVNAAAGRKLRANKGLTLQWIDWNRRGTARVTVVDGVWTLRGEQAERGGPGRLRLDGQVTEVGRDYFLFDGTVTISDTPDRGRQCEKHDLWRFAITQNRRYWRIRTFEWCDELTDYIDIYF